MIQLILHKLKYEFLIIDGFKNHLEALEVIKEFVSI
jgi:hypothetical protein